MYTFSYHWCWHLTSSPAELWPYASDTDRFDAMTGLPPISVRSETIDGEEQEVVGMRLFGMPVEWTQDPFEWVEPHEFSVRREYLRGPVAWMQVDARLEPADDGGTDLHYQVEAAPANPLGYLAIPLQIGRVAGHHIGPTRWKISMQWSHARPARSTTRLTLSTLSKLRSTYIRRCGT